MYLNLKLTKELMHDKMPAIDDKQLENSDVIEEALPLKLNEDDIMVENDAKKLLLKS